MVKKINISRAALHRIRQEAMQHERYGQIIKEENMDKGRTWKDVTIWMRRGERGDDWGVIYIGKKQQRQVEIVVNEDMKVAELWMRTHY